MNCLTFKIKGKFDITEIQRTFMENVPLSCKIKRKWTKGGERALFDNEVLIKTLLWEFHSLTVFLCERLE